MAKMPIMDRSISGVTKGREAMLNLKHLDYFYEVARCGSITKAAQNLYMTQPALSKAIHQLEDDLNCKLLNRTIKGVSLTSQGGNPLGRCNHLHAAAGEGQGEDC